MNHNEDFEISVYLGLEELSFAMWPLNKMVFVLVSQMWYTNGWSARNCGVSSGTIKALNGIATTPEIHKYYYVWC